MDNQFKLGKVIWFNPQKRYGFLENLRGSQIFFHFNDGRFVEVKEGILVYGEPTVLGFNNRCSSLPDAKPGDIIRFEFTKGSKGRPKASPWCYDYMFVETLLNFERDNELCPNCGHRERDHAGALCMEPICHCGDEAYEHDDDEPREVNLGGDPGGFKIYE